MHLFTFGCYLYIVSSHFASQMLSFFATLFEAKLIFFYQLYLTLGFLAVYLLLPLNTSVSNINQYLTSWHKLSYHVNFTPVLVDLLLVRLMKKSRLGMSRAEHLFPNILHRVHTCSYHRVLYFAILPSLHPVFPPESETRRSLTREHLIEPAGRKLREQTPTSPLNFIHVAINSRLMYISAVQRLKNTPSVLLCPI